MPKPLAELLAALPVPYTLRGDAQTLVHAPVVESDADVEPGGVFVARAGLSSDGHAFIARAVERGAAAVVGEKPLENVMVPYAQVENAAEAVGYLAAACHDFPSRKLVVVGVTGTDGKTTTSTLLHSILNADGRAGLISTIAARIGGESIDTGLHVTTPGAPLIHALLAKMVAAGLRYCVLEMTSHGLAQGRLNGVDVDVAVLTNLTHEHLDYHKTFENYRAAKARLFEMLTHSQRKPGQAKISVVNADDPNAAFFAAIPADRVVRYGVHERADYRATDILHRPGYTQYVLRKDDAPLIAPLMLPLAGGFNVYNSLAAAAVARELGFHTTAIESGLLRVTAIPGRLERIDEGQDFIALVDFAHTPNALKNALEAARGMAHEGGRVIVVFGSAGLRDREKRRLMPDVAIRLADMTVLTAEDPRTESLDAILATMAEAARGAGGVEGRDFVRIADRGEALYQACRMARAGDVVIACGKGHEQSMAFGTTEYPWDDRDGLRAALRGAPLRTLPSDS